MEKIKSKKMGYQKKEGVGVY